MEAFMTHKLFAITEDETSSFKHPFEATLGPRPYTLERIYECASGEESLICDHCGENTLRTKFFIKASNGVEFGVGSRCVGLLKLEPKQQEKFKQLKREKARRDRDAVLWKKLGVCIDKVQGEGRNFIISLQNQFQRKGKLSGKQKAALDKFYTRCK